MSIQRFPLPDTEVNIPPYRPAPAGLAPDADEAPEDFGDMSIRQWLYGHRIVAFTGRSASRLSVDAWNEAIEDVLSRAPLDRPCFVLIDLSDKRNGMSPYSRERQIELTNFRPELKTQVAIVVPSTVLGTLIKFFARSVMQKPHLETRLFMRRDEAVQWLKSEVNRFESSPASASS